MDAENPIVSAIRHYAKWEALQMSAASADSDAETIAMMAWGALTMAGIKTDRVHGCAGGWHFEVPVSTGEPPLNVFVVPNPDDVFAWLANLLNGEPDDAEPTEPARDAEPLNDNDPTITRAYN